MTTLTVQTLVDGDRNAVLKGYVTGTAAQLTDELFVDVSALSGSPTRVSILGIQATMGVFTSTLEWDADTDVPILELPSGETFEHCYRRFGGLHNNAGTGITGDITLTTLLVAAGTHGTIILELKKN